MRNLEQLLGNLDNTKSTFNVEQGRSKMRTVKKDVVTGSINGKQSTFTTEIVKSTDGFEITYSDNKGWGIGHKTYQKCSDMNEAAGAYSELLQLIQM